MHGKRGNFCTILLKIAEKSGETDFFHGFNSFDPMDILQPSAEANQPACQRDDFSVGVVIAEDCDKMR